jgi:hypothetical protein
MAAARSAHREVYIDAFRGLMALVMVQGHLCDALLSPRSGPPSTDSRPSSTARRRPASCSPRASWRL